MKPSEQNSLEPHRVLKSRRIFVNRNLRMDTVKVIGFDMDYTLARYARERLERLAYDLTVEKMCERGYPQSLKEIEYDPSFVIRGLCVDKQLGNIIKLDRHGHACRVIHGKRTLSKLERRSLYRREKINFSPPRFAMVDTLFALPEMSLYASLIDDYESTKTRVDPWKLFDDIRESIDEAHRDGSLKAVVQKDIPHYIEKDHELAATLHKLRSSGKKLFLLTNSYFKYTDSVMSYLLGDELSEYPSWKNYFELIVVGAQKPGFFMRDDPMTELDDNGEVVGLVATKLKRGVVYQGGNRIALEKSLGHEGEELLYVGDHIYGDILRSKKVSLWRTALVLEELEDEIDYSEAEGEKYQLLYDLENERRRLDDLANIQRRQMAQLDKDDRDNSKFSAIKAERDENKKRLKQVIRKIDQLGLRLDAGYNRFWGLTFKEDQENSRFAEQVEDYACVYTSRVTNFLRYSAHQYFRSPRDLLPHERS